MARRRRGKPAKTKPLTKAEVVLVLEKAQAVLRWCREWLPPRDDRIAAECPELGVLHDRIDTVVCARMHKIVKQEPSP